ncbi:heme A synthase [Kineosphaera limosa]|uniref:Uncharacterized protein n=1 Tax=Kineosphaera limosa NBRC 100340 TaxID=1184609 RepID=K6X186_9MICO|nr:hypothetical protein [Kineosphaera limosa]NYE01970.1 heme A synthase [Kineosphaera limosa]GAB98137.1 hypothetical protein KILIM_103_00020 [Kineosphaera limosa NBRC 100340]
MRIPSRQLMALRTMVTVQLSAIIAQSGWAAAALGGEEHYWRNHSLGALFTSGVCVLGAGLYVLLRRNAGPVNVTLAVSLAAAVGVQYALGEAGVRAIHIFFGILIAMLATALTSWTYRHDDGQPPGFGPGAAAHQSDSQPLTEGGRRG